MPSFQLNRQQSKFLDTAYWALNSNTDRGSGRSTAMAFVAIQMAMLGATVHMIDPSLVLVHGTNMSAHRHFARRVIDVARTYFSEHEFELRASDNTLRYVGPRAPRVTFTPITPVPVTPSFDDDGSEENT